MIDRTDLMNAHEVELLRRSVAMLRPKANAFDREDALRVLTALGQLLEDDDASRWVTNEDS
ncbi:MAG: hypothetical protein OEV40_29635 [Acidimicrobiia bacterium]|nr:hypothetical protein [Acidimicrobiia bacterium]